MTYRRFKTAGRNAMPATAANSATVSDQAAEVSQNSQVSHGVSNQRAPREARTVASVAAPEIDPEDWQAAFDERAGHLEYDCHLPRAEAERLALADTVAALGPCPVTIH